MMATEIITTEEFIKRNKQLHLLHIKYGYPKGQRPKVSQAKRKRVYERDKGGNNEDSNLTVSCHQCNRKKHTRYIKPRYVRGEKVAKD